MKKYHYDIVLIGGNHRRDEVDLKHLNEAGSKGFRVVHVFTESEEWRRDDRVDEGPACLVELEYEGDTKDEHFSWMDYEPER